MFHELRGEVERTLFTTGPNGRAEFPLHWDGGRYLLKAVNLEPKTDGRAAWGSDWASLTFEAPAR